MSLRGLLRNALQARQEDGRVRKPARVGHSAFAISFHFTCRCPVRRGKISEGVKVIKVEDQKRRMADSKPYSSINTSNKCTVCVY